MLSGAGCLTADVCMLVLASSGRLCLLESAGLHIHLVVMFAGAVLCSVVSNGIACMVFVGFCI